MKERGMIFNAEMVRAILDGRKTQTRRIMKVQPDTPEFGLRHIIESSMANEIGMYFWSQNDACGIKARSKTFSCPFGVVGDRIWVRETFAAFDADWEFPGRPHDIKDGPWPNIIYPASVAKAPPGTSRPSVHMPRWASRITLEITAVRVERLNVISDTDAIREGCSIVNMMNGDRLADVFSRLWSSIYGIESWQANPWVWVIEFKRIEGGAA